MSKIHGHKLSASQSVKILHSGSIGQDDLEYYKFYHCLKEGDYMTFKDLLSLIKRYFGWLIAIPLICGLVALGVSFFRSDTNANNFKAISKITVTDPSGTLSSLSMTLLLNASAEDAISDTVGDEAKIEIDAEGESQSVSFSVTARTEQNALQVADEVTALTIQRMQAELDKQAQAFADQGTVDSANSNSEFDNESMMKAAALKSCVYSIAPASLQENDNSTFRNALKYGLIGLIAGILLVLFGLSLFDVERQPIKSYDDISRVTSLPLLNNTERLPPVDIVRANLLLLHKDKLASVCLFPVAVPCNEFGSDLQQALKEDWPETEITIAAPWNSSAHGCFTASTSDLVIVVVTRWSTTSESLGSALKELDLIKANTRGIVLL